MQVRLIEEGFDSRYPYAICGEDGFVKARFKNESEATAWAVRNRFEIIENPPHYGD